MFRLSPRRLSNIWKGPYLGRKMFKHTLTLPIRAVSHNKYHKRFSLERHFQTFPRRDAASTHEPAKRPCPDEGSGKGFYYTLGAVLVGTGTVVAYAKYDDEFRDWLRENVPFSDEFISFVTAEETNHIDYIARIVRNTKNAVMDDLMGVFNSVSPGSGKDQIKGKTEKKDLPPCDEDALAAVKYKSPPPVFKSEPPKVDEERTSKKKGDTEQIDKGEPHSRDKAKKSSSFEEERDSIAGLERELNKSAESAVQAYTDAMCLLTKYSEAVYKLVDASVEKADQKMWKMLKEKSNDLWDKIDEAEDNARSAEVKVKMMKDKMESTKLDANDEAKAKAKKNTEKILGQIKEAKKKFDDERMRASVTEKYWKKVQQARSHFSEELESLFPNIRLDEKKMKIPEADFDLFILYAHQNILLLQKEISKLDTITKDKMRLAAMKSKQGGGSEAIEAAIEQEVEKERRKICAEYQKKLMNVKAECSEDNKKLLKAQNDMHNELLQDALAAKEKEIERNMRREIEERLMEEKEKYREEMAGLMGRLKGMDDTMKKRACQDKRSAQAQLLWSAAESLLSAVTAAGCSKPLRPLSEEVQSIRKASEGDELVQVILDAIPEEVTNRGVYNEAALKTRFLNVHRVAQRVALVPEGGASLPVLFLSYLQSLVVVSPANPIPCHELENQPFNADGLNTFEILQRARHFVDMGDWYNCLRYLNLLKGAPRVVSQDFINELRIFLETKQAADVLLAHASAASLAL